MDCGGVDGMAGFGLAIFGIRIILRDLEGRMNESRRKLVDI